MKLASGITIVLLLTAALFNVLVEHKSAAKRHAENYIGACKEIEFEGAHVFQSLGDSNKTAFIFECKGFQGPIKALFILTKDDIEQFTIIKSYEGADKRVLANQHFLNSFQQNINHLPIEADAVTGATISSQIIIDEMNILINNWHLRND